MKEKSMHITAARLMRAAKELKGADGPSEVARLLNVAPQMITNWMARGVSRNGMVTAERLIGCSASWLMTGEGQMGGNPAKHDFSVFHSANTTVNAGVTAEQERAKLGRLEDELPRPTEEEFAYVPQLDVSAACGEGRFQDHVVVKGGLAFKRSSLRDFGVPEHAARIIYAAGGSMAPTIQDGCVVLVNTADVTPIDGKVYLICKPDGGLILKRLVRDYHPAVGGQAWIMRSDNPDKIAHPDKVLPPDDRTMIAGRAVWNDNRL